MRGGLGVEPRWAHGLPGRGERRTRLRARAARARVPPVRAMARGARRRDVARLGGNGLARDLRPRRKAHRARRFRVRERRAGGRDDRWPMARRARTDAHRARRARRCRGHRALARVGDRKAPHPSRRGGRRARAVRVHPTHPRRGQRVPPPLFAGPRGCDRRASNAASRVGARAGSEAPRERHLDRLKRPRAHPLLPGERRDDAEVVPVQPTHFDRPVARIDDPRSPGRGGDRMRKRPRRAAVARPLRTDADGGGVGGGRVA